MSETPAGPSILLVDDGELDGVARTLERLGCGFERLRGSEIPSDVAPPRDLLIATPRRLERVRRGSPAEAAPDRPLRILAVEEDSPALRRQFRSAGLHLVVQLPAQAEIWRLLVSRALYRGHERRRDSRVAVGSPVQLVDGGRDPASTPATLPTPAMPPTPPTPPTSPMSPAAPTSPAASEQPRVTTILMDLSNRGCRLRSSRPVSVGESLSFTIAPDEGDALDRAEPLLLRGRVRRMTQDSGSDQRSLALVFDANLPESTRVRLTSLINRWASGPSSTGAAATTPNEPPLPPCRLPSLPDLMLDDETDPPVRARSEIRVELSPAATEDPTAAANERDRRWRPRGRFETSFLAETPRGPLVLIGRELSAGGMRVERLETLRVGDRFRLALHGPGPAEPCIVEAEVARDDGSHGYALVFRQGDPEAARALEKLVACLPDVASSSTSGSTSGCPDESEPGGGLGALLSEILSA